MSLVASGDSTDRYSRSAKDALKRLRGESDLECSTRSEPRHKLIRAALEGDSDGSIEPQVRKLFGSVSPQAMVRGIERDKPIVLLMDGQESLLTAASHFRCVVKDRPERSGMRWVLNGANAMLGLRSIRASGLWKQFIDYRIRRATETIYLTFGNQFSDR